jgi:hypothetical protein
MDIVAMQARVETLIREGRPFNHVEDFIDDTPLNGDQKAALWLFAWALQPRERLREETTLTLMLVG